MEQGHILGKVQNICPGRCSTIKHKPLFPITVKIKSVISQITEYTVLLKFEH